jgi:hypothetical protein
MSRRTGFVLAAAAAIGLGGVLAASGLAAVTPAAADALNTSAGGLAASPVNDISAQRKKGGQKARGRTGGQPKAKGTGRPRPAAKGSGRQRPGANRPRGQRPAAKGSGRQRPGANRPRGQRPAAKGTGRPRPGARPAARPPRATAARRGPRRDVRIRAGGPIRIGGRRVTVIRGGHRYRWRGRYWDVAPIAALTALTLGAIAYAPYAYVPVAQPLCTGYTEDGCFLRWTEVPTSQGDLIPQCVTYCEGS